VNVLQMKEHVDQLLRQVKYAEELLGICACRHPRQMEKCQRVAELYDEAKQAAMEANDAHNVAQNEIVEW
jgi:uncharacterized protein with PhoU and TrkA domain